MTDPIYHFCDNKKRKPKNSADQKISDLAKITVNYFWDVFNHVFLCTFV